MSGPGDAAPEVHAPPAATIGLFVGKGGVGKSTLAGATAVRHARAGQRVLAVSTDQAHSLGDVFGVRVDPSPGAHCVRVIEDPYGGELDVMALDTLGLLERRWGDIADTIAAQYPESDIGSLAPEELSALPGVQEMLGLHEVQQLADTGEWDVVVVDCASTADALRMLTLPGTFAMYLERAWPRHRRLGGVGTPRALILAELLERIAASADRLAVLLSDAERVGAHLVLTPERVVVAEAIRTVGALALMGVRIDQVIVNQVLIQDDSYEYHNLPEHPAFDWYMQRITDQSAVLDEMGEAIGDVEMLLVPHLPREPIGPDALGELAESVRRRDGAKPPAPLATVVEHESGSGADTVYRLRLELPQIDPATLSLGRVGDDLVIGANGMRRRVRLASVLRRCVVVDARLVGGELTIRFRADPEVWPT